MASLASMFSDSGTEQEKMTIDKMSKTLDDIFKRNTKKSSKIVSDIAENKKDIYDSIFDSNNPIAAIHEYKNKELKTSEKDALLWSLISSETDLNESKGQIYGTYLTFKNGALSNEEAKYLAQYYGLDAYKDIKYTKDNVREKIASWANENGEKWDKFQEDYDYAFEHDYNGLIKKTDKKLNNQVKQAEEIVKNTKNEIAHNKELKEKNIAGKEQWNNRKFEFLGNLGEDDPLFKLSGQEELEKISKSFHNDRIKKQFLDRQLDTGNLQRQYEGFDFSKGLDSLTDGQLNRVYKDYDNLVSSRLERYIDAPINIQTNGKMSGKRFIPDSHSSNNYGPHKLNWEKGELDRRLVANPEMAQNAYGFNSLFNIESNKPIKTGGQYDKSLNAYKDYLGKNINNVKEDLMDLSNFLSKKQGLTKKEIQSATKDLRAAGHVLESSVTDGISKAAKHTGLKVAGKLAIGALAIMGLGEIFDED